MSDMIRRDAACAAVQALIKDATAIGQRTVISHALTAIRALPAVEVGVRKLEWKWSTQVQGWRADCELTRDVFIAYQTNEKWSAGSQWFGTTYHKTAEAAKTHLDQMRAARIRSALTATPATVASPAQDATHGLESCMSQDVAGLVKIADRIEAQVECTRETMRMASLSANDLSTLGILTGHFLTMAGDLRAALARIKEAGE